MADGPRCVLMIGADRMAELRDPYEWWEIPTPTRAEKDARCFEQKPQQRRLYQRQQQERAIAEQGTERVVDGRGGPRVGAPHSGGGGVFFVVIVIS